MFLSKPFLSKPKINVGPQGALQPRHLEMVDTGCVWQNSGLGGHQAEAPWTGQARGEELWPFPFSHWQWATLRPCG